MVRDSSYFLHRNWWGSVSWGSVEEPCLKQWNFSEVRFLHIDANNLIGYIFFMSPYYNFHHLWTSSSLLMSIQFSVLVKKLLYLLKSSLSFLQNLGQVWRLLGQQQMPKFLLHFFWVYFISLFCDELVVPCESLCGLPTPFFWRCLRNISLLLRIEGLQLKVVFLYGRVIQLEGGVDFFDELVV